VTAGRIDQANLRIGYVRGAGVVMDSRRTLRALVVVSVLVLATLTIVLTREAINANARISRLRQHGVPVDVTVTSCLGLASGSGITEAGYRCRGTFTLKGHHYILRDALLEIERRPADASATWIPRSPPGGRGSGAEATWAAHRRCWPGPFRRWCSRAARCRCCAHGRGHEGPRVVGLGNIFPANVGNAVNHRTGGTRRVSFSRQLVISLLALAIRTQQGSR